MTPRKQISILLSAMLVMAFVAPSHAQDREKPVGVAAKQSAKQQCLNTCRVRYRDCLSLKQISSAQCRGVYQDCSRIVCNNLRRS